jgi:hypothetical protein
VNLIEAGSRWRVCETLTIARQRVEVGHLRNTNFSKESIKDKDISVLTQLGLDGLSCKSEARMRERSMQHMRRCEDIPVLEFRSSHEGVIQNAGYT